MLCLDNNMHRSVRQDSREKVTLQGRFPRDFSGHCDACNNNTNISFFFNLT